jgi:hypothetical protein
MLKQWLPPELTTVSQKRKPNNGKFADIRILGLSALTLSTKIKRPEVPNALPKCRVYIMLKTVNPIAA